MTKSREVNLSGLKGFHLHFAPKMRSGVTGVSDYIWKSMDSRKNLQGIDVISLSALNKVGMIHHGTLCG